MKNTHFGNDLNNLIDLIDAYRQYGQPQQAGFYPGLRRTRVQLTRQLLAAGVDLRAIHARRQACKRPNGYADAEVREYAGYMVFWGLGGERGARPAGRLP